jgi:hypothetical protein
VTNFPKGHFNIALPPTLKFPQSFVSLQFSWLKFYMHFSHPHIWYMPYHSHYLLPRYSNNPQRSWSYSLCPPSPPPPQIFWIPHSQIRSTLCFSSEWNINFHIHDNRGCQDSRVITEKGIGRKDRFPARKSFFFTSKWLRLSPGRSQPSVHWVYKVLPPRLKQVEFEADHSPSSISRKSTGKATFLLLRKSLQQRV